MSRLGVVLVFVACALASCDGGEPTPESQFPPLRDLDSLLGGRVRRDRELVEGAAVRIEAPRLAPVTSTTSPNGFYQFQISPQTYDLHVVLGSELTTFRGAAQRYFEPLLAGALAPRVNSARVNVVPSPALPPKQKLVFAVTGNDVVGLRAADATGFTVDFRPYQLVKVPTDATCLTGIIVHAIAIADDGSLAAPLAYGNACISHISADQQQALPLVMTPVEQKLVPFTVRVGGADGMVAEPIALGVHFGAWQTAMPVATIVNGGTASLVRIPFGNYVVRARARQGRALADSGVQAVEPNDGAFQIVLPTPPQVTPTTIGDDLVFDVTAGAGVREVTLTPASSNPSAATTHVVSTESLVTVPDPRPMGLPAIAGRYTCTVRYWPKLATTDALAGVDARERNAFADAAPFDVTR